MPRSVAAVSFPKRLMRLSPAWQMSLAQLAFAWIGLFALFHGDWADMAAQWWGSSTYNHILIIPPILAWLVRQRASELARIEPSGWWPGLVLAGLAALLWVLGAFAGVATARQLGVVLLQVTAVLTLLGPRIGAGLAFPLGYALFLVPFGDEVVPQLQMITAEITIALVRLSGVPAVIDGVFIDTPAGLFEVAEACSGVKFLIAMIAFGVLVANSCFVSWRRRAIFLAACVVVPILANGIRAWGTVFAAQHVGAEAAAGFDHIVYGWIFFAVVLGLVVAGGWRFFDRPAEDRVIDSEVIASAPVLNRLAAMGIRGAVGLAGLAAIVLVGKLWAQAADSLSASVPDQIFLPEVVGWRRVDYAPLVWWEPRAHGASHRLLGRYADAEGRQVDVFLAVYAAQGEGREAGGFGEGALTPESDWAWLASGPAATDARSERLLGASRFERLVETRYRTGSLTTASNARLRLATIGDKLLLRVRPTLLLILSAEERKAAPARDAIIRFRRATGPLDQWMDRIAGVR